VCHAPVAISATCTAPRPTTIATKEVIAQPTIGIASTRHRCSSPLAITETTGRIAPN